MPPDFSYFGCLNLLFHPLYTSFHFSNFHLLFCIPGNVFFSILFCIDCLKKIFPYPSRHMGHPSALTVISTHHPHQVHQTLPHFHLFLLNKDDFFWGGGGQWLVSTVNEDLLSLCVYQRIILTDSFFYKKAINKWYLIIWLLHSLILHLLWCSISLFHNAQKIQSIQMQLDSNSSSFGVFHENQELFTYTHLLHETIKWNDIAVHSDYPITVSYNWL